MNTSLVRSGSGKGLLRHAARPEQERAAARAAIEQHVERRQSRHERLAAALRVDGMAERLPLHGNTGALERRAVEIAARAAQAAEKRVGAQRAADVDDELGLDARHLQLGAAHERRTDAEGFALELERGEVQ